MFENFELRRTHSHLFKSILFRSMKYLLLYCRKSYPKIIEHDITFNFGGKFQIEFGRLPGSTHTAVQDFDRSALGDQISFTCAGWCGSCGPISGPIRFQHSTEFSRFMPMFGIQQ